MDAPSSKDNRPLPFSPGMLKGKSAVVTGSTSGIGPGIAEAFAVYGADVLLNGFRDSAEIEEIPTSLKEATEAELVVPRELAEMRGARIDPESISISSMGGPV